MSWIWAALMPHPPIIVPEVGRGREKEAAATLAGLAGLTGKLASLANKGRPDILLLLSPHQPYAEGALYLNSAGTPRGGLADFGAPEVEFSLQTPGEALISLGRHLADAGLNVSVGPEPRLTPDQGSLVPLHFLRQAFGELPPVILGSPIGLSPRESLALGRALAGFKAGPESWAFLASGDLSHRLTPDAPAGFDPEAAEFDRDVAEALSSGSPQTLLERWPLSRLRKAGECGYRSALALMGLAGGPVEVFSHEGPFGVGYCNALWLPPKSAEGSQ